jgi:hypothetical protein
MGERPWAPSETRFFNEGKFDLAAFRNRQNFFARRNVTAIVIEVPSESIGLTGCGKSRPIGPDIGL